jgi:hypothetical protein
MTKSDDGLSPMNPLTARPDDGFTSPKELTLVGRLNQMVDRHHYRTAYCIPPGKEKVLDEKIHNGLHAQSASNR